MRELAVPILAAFGAEVELLEAELAKATKAASSALGEPCLVLLELCQAKFDVLRGWLVLDAVVLGHGRQRPVEALVMRDSASAKLGKDEKGDDERWARWITPQRKSLLESALKGAGTLAYSRVAALTNGGEYLAVLNEWGR